MLFFAPTWHRRPHAGCGPNKAWQRANKKIDISLMVTAVLIGWVYQIPGLLAPKCPGKAPSIERIGGRGHTMGLSTQFASGGFGDTFLLGFVNQVICL